MTTLPHATNQATLNNLCEDATHRFGCWYNLTGELIIGKQALAGGAWTTHQIAGTARTALALPADVDGHCYPAMGIDSGGRLHVMANMHNDALQYIRQNTAGDITAWSVGPSLPSVGIRCTYPTFVHRPDGTLRVYLRDVGWTAQGDGAYWDWTGSAWSSRTLLFQGLSVPNAKGAGVPGDGFGSDTIYNWSPYPAVHVEAAATGWVEHWFVVWRIDDTGDVEDPADRHNVIPSYVQYRSATSTWHTVTGTTVSPPFDPVNQTGIQTGQVAGSEGYVNLSALTATVDGYPHIIVSQDPWYRIVWTPGGGWVQTRMGNPAPSGSWSMNGFNLVSRVDPVRIRGDIWYSGTSWSSGGALIRPRMWRADGTCSVSLGGDVTANWAVQYADQAWQKRGTVERLTPDGNTPAVVTHGNGTRRAA